MKPRTGSGAAANNFGDYEMTVDTAELTVNGSGLAHRGRNADLMISTVPSGNVVLLMDDENLQQMKVEIDRLLQYRRGSPARNSAVPSRKG